MKKLIFTLTIILLAGANLLASDYYWVGGTGNWTDFSTHWATTSGGSTFHTQVPTEFDNVFFNSNSFPAAGAVVTINADATCADMTWTGAANNPTFAGTSSYDLNIYGSLTFITAMTNNFSGAVYFKSLSTGNTITSAGQSFKYPVYFDGIGGWTLLDGLNLGNQYLHFVKGTLNTNNQPVNAIAFYSDYTNVRTLNLGSSIITLSHSNNGYNGYSLEIDATNLSLNAGSSVIKFTSANSSFYKYYGNQLSFNDVIFTATSGTSYIYGANCTFNKITFNNDGNIYYGITVDSLIFNKNGAMSNSNTIGTLILNPGNEYTLPSNSTQTILNNLVANGTETQYIIINSSTSGTQATISKTIGNITVEYVSLKDSKASGGATFVANNSLDLGNNTGWTINAPGGKNYYWVGGTGNWNSASEWSLTSGGAGGAGIPTLLDNVFFDSNSFTSTSQTVTIVGDASGNASCHNMTWTGALNNPTLAGTSSYNLRIYGSLTLTPNMSYTFAGYVVFEASDTGNTVFTGGILLNRLC